jgi:hypothetical protein
MQVDALRAAVSWSQHFRELHGRNPSENELPSEHLCAIQQLQGASARSRAAGDTEPKSPQHQRATAVAAEQSMDDDEYIPDTPESAKVYSHIASLIVLGRVVSLFSQALESPNTPPHDRPRMAPIAHPRRHV